ncbi:MAG: WecB/TagA/CpsF family glycosyltransferase, partial [Armatimonadota bacterium]
MTIAGLKYSNKIISERGHIWKFIFFINVDWNKVHIPFLPNCKDITDLNGQIRDLLSRNLNAWVVTVNTDVHRQLTLLKSNKEIELIEAVGIKTADGFPIKAISNYLEPEGYERLTGSDLIIDLIPLCSELGIPIYIGGGENGEARRAKKKIESSMCGVSIYALDVPFGSVELVTLFLKTNIQLDRYALFLGLGTPKQELVLANLYTSSNGCIFLGCGAGISYQSGSKRRSPRWIQKINMEWLFRFLHEPRRLGKRYFVEDIRHIIKLST